MSSHRLKKTYLKYRSQLFQKGNLDIFEILRVGRTVQYHRQCHPIKPSTDHPGRGLLARGTGGAPDSDTTC